MDTEFSNYLRTRGHKYQIDTSGYAVASADDVYWSSEKLIVPKFEAGSPARMSQSMAPKWVGQALIRIQGRELGGNFSPLLVGELFWE